MLGENIKTYRQKKGYTQEEVANRLHVTRQTISKWEKNYSVPDAEIFVKLADVLLNLYCRMFQMLLMRKLWKKSQTK